LEHWWIAENQEPQSLPVNLGCAVQNLRAKGFHHGDVTGLPPLNKFMCNPVSVEDGTSLFPQHFAHDRFAAGNPTGEADMFHSANDL
jgi:hypothetical protein